MNDLPATVLRTKSDYIQLSVEKCRKFNQPLIQSTDLHSMTYKQKKKNLIEFINPCNNENNGNLNW